MAAFTASELSWSDATFTGFHWKDDEATPTLVLHLRSNDKPSCVLECVWACHLEVELDYDMHVGPLLTSDVTFSSLPDGGWSVHVDLPPQGFIKYQCNDLQLVAGG